MKKIINRPEDLVLEMCEGIVAAHPKELAFKKKYKLLMRKELNNNKALPAINSESSKQRLFIIKSSVKLFT